MSTAAQDARAELGWHTPAVWAAAVLVEPEALLSDHAHLERAAAANALALVRRWPDGAEPDRWVSRLSGIARDEVEHLALVSRVLAQRGGALARTHRNPYAAGLRDHVRIGSAQELADRLLVSAAIELRSYERFCLLAEAGHELSDLYAGLRDSEAGHHRVFVHLATQAGAVEDDVVRWRAIEADVARAQPPGFAVHAGI